MEMLVIRGFGTIVDGEWIDATNPSVDSNILVMVNNGWIIDPREMKFVAFLYGKPPRNCERHIASMSYNEQQGLRKLLGKL